MPTFLMENKNLFAGTIFKNSFTFRAHHLRATTWFLQVQNPVDK